MKFVWRGSSFALRAHSLAGQDSLRRALVLNAFTGFWAAYHFWAAAHLVFELSFVNAINAAANSAGNSLAALCVAFGRSMTFPFGMAAAN
jgi:hypothetical protein